MGSLTAERLRLERRAALLSTLLWWQPEQQNLRRADGRGTPRSGQCLRHQLREFYSTSSSLHGIQTQTTHFPPRPSFANRPVPPSPIFLSPEESREKRTEWKHTRNTLRGLGIGFQAIPFQVKQAHKANEKQTAHLTDTHQFPETVPLLSSNPPHHRCDLNKKTRRRRNNVLFSHSQPGLPTTTKPLRPLSEMRGANHGTELFPNALKYQLGFSRSSATTFPR